MSKNTNINAPDETDLVYIEYMCEMLENKQYDVAAEMFKNIYLKAKNGQWLSLVLTTIFICGGLSLAAHMQSYRSTAENVCNN